MDNRDIEFPQLRGMTYLDHVGCTLPSKSQLTAATSQLLDSTFGNPHSQNPSSTATSNEIERVRELVLEFFNTTLEHYDVVFTSGTTSGCKIISENFPWSNQSEFRYLLESHNSVLGMRCRAYECGANITVIDGADFTSGTARSVVREDKSLMNAESSLIKGRCARDIAGTYNLFAYPAECNFSGTKYPLDVDLGDNWYTLLDASCFAATNPLDLSAHRPDFVTVSFYKIFGYPSGLGALLLRRESSKILKFLPRSYFGGGTVAASLSDGLYHVPRRDIASSLEDGTVHFQGILALVHGFNAITKVGGMVNIQSHTFNLARSLFERLKSLRHGNGSELVHVYGTSWSDKVTSDKQGSIVTFGLKREDGEWIGSGEIDRIVSYNNVNIRSGCFCNPGACHSLLGLTQATVLENAEVHGVVCWDQGSGGLVNGKPIGACRASFGYMSNEEDVDKLVNVIKNHWLNVVPHKIERLSTGDGMQVQQLMVYPIKSCGPFRPVSWPYTAQGFAYDREWVVIGGDRVPLIQKKAPILALVKPEIDPVTRVVMLYAPDMPKLEIKLDSFSGGEVSKVREDLAYIYGDDIRRWFTRLCCRPATLARYLPQDEDQATGHSNSAPFLLVNEASVTEIQSLVEEPSDHIDALRFRPNIVVNGDIGFVEDNWRSLSVGSQELEWVGGCARCGMIAIDQHTAQYHPDALKALAMLRNDKGRMFFGALFKPTTDLGGVINVGSKVIVRSIKS